MTELARFIAITSSILACVIGTSRQEVQAQATTDDPRVQKLLSEARASTRAWMEGDSAPVASQMSHTEEFTIFGPFGGTPPPGWTESSARAQAAAAAQFRGATSSTVDLIQAYVSDELIVLVLVERNRVKFDDSEPQQWDLRTTQVYKREGDDWKIVHRHADPLVTPRSLGQTLQLFRP